MSTLVLVLLPHTVSSEGAPSAASAVWAVGLGRPTPNPASSTRAADAMGAPVRSLANLQSCADALREATEGQYSIGIKAAKKAMGNAKSDFKGTIDRVAEASRWKKGTIEDGLSRGEVVCANLMEEAEEVLKKAEAREEAEAKIRIMEGQCEELAGLAEQAGTKSQPRPRLSSWWIWRRR
jgi:hypothetical protein